MNYLHHIDSAFQGESHEPVDEEHVTRAHHEAYSNGNAGNLDSGSMGAAAAMQVHWTHYCPPHRYSSKGSIYLF